MQARAGEDDGVFVKAKIHFGKLGADVGLDADEPVWRKTIRHAHRRAQREFVVVFLRRLFPPRELHAAVDVEDERVVEEVFVQDDLGIEIDFLLLEPGHIVVGEVSRFEAHGEAHLVLERAEHAVFRRQLDAAETILIHVIQLLDIADAEVVLLDGNADLEFVGDAVFDLRVKVPSFVGAAAFSRAEGDELVGIRVAAGQRLSPAHPAEEMFAGVDGRSDERCEKR